MNGLTGTPVNSVWFVAVIATLLGLLSLAGPQAINAVFALCVTGLYFAYSIPIAARFIFKNNFKPGPFNLGIFVSLITYREQRPKLIPLRVESSCRHHCCFLHGVHGHRPLVPCYAPDEHTEHELYRRRSRRCPRALARLVLLPCIRRCTLVHWTGAERA